MSEFNHKAFLEFEKKHFLFALEHGSCHYWDIIRYDIYTELLWSYTSRVRPRNKKSILSLWNSLSEFMRFLFFSFFKRSDYIFFTASRNKGRDGLFYDQNGNDVLLLLEKKSFILENFEPDKKKRLYKKSVFHPLGPISLIIRRFMPKRDYSSLLHLIKSEFSEFSLGNEVINNLVNGFIIDRFLYKYYFKVRKPVKIFITQNGIQKGLFAAARQIGIPVIEFQHGIIDEGHISYNYSRDINYKEEMLYLPSAFLTFSDFWSTEIYYPGVKIVAVGNSAFNSLGGTKKQTATVEAKQGIVVASSDIFGPDLLQLVIDFCNKGQSLPIYFKLHPNQFNEYDQYLKELAAFPNVQLISKEKSIYELMELCDSVLAVQSTALYEGLHLNKRALIYKRKSYRRHEHIFDKPNVHLVNNATELESAIKQSIILSDCNQTLFFQAFNLEKINSLL